jgi:hypothetical protein
MQAEASAFLTQMQMVFRTSASTSENKQITVSCPSGKRVLGAGGDASPGSGQVMVDAIRPNAALTRVTARAREDETGSGADWVVVAYAVCAAPPTGMERVVTTSASSSSATRSVAAACPAGKRLLGLGGEVGSPNGQVLLDGLLPNAALTQATVNALEDETGNADPWALTAYAICSDPIAGLERVLGTTTTGSEAFKSAGAQCPAGKTLVSPGGTIDSPNGQILFDGMFPGAELTGSAFSAGEDETGNSADWNVTAYAVCAASVGRFSSATERTITDSATANRACPPGTDGTGVGGEVSGALGQAWLRRLFIGDLGTDFMNAMGAADETGVASPFAVTTHGLCATAIAGRQLIVAEGASNSTASKTSVAACPEGLRVLGAGASVSEPHQVTIDGMRPDPTLAFVTASAREDRTGFSGTWSVTAYAICAPPPAGLQLVQRAGPLGSNEVADVSAGCPAGRHVIGTGAEIVNGSGRVGFDDVLANFELTRTTVLATEDEAGFDGDWRPVAYSICMDR